MNEDNTGISLTLDSSLCSCWKSEVWEPPKIRVFVYQDGTPIDVHWIEITTCEEENELKETILKILEPHITNKHIIKSKIYEFPLQSLIRFLPTGFHAFIVMETPSHFISWEKGIDGFTIQISNIELDVINMREIEERDGEKTLSRQDACDAQLSSILQFFAEGNFLHEGYNVVTGIHCKKFARALFERIAENHSYDYKSIENGAKGEWLSVAIGATACTLATATAAFAVLIIPLSCDHELHIGY